jgi:hypothetical protein
MGKMACATREERSDNSVDMRARLQATARGSLVPRTDRTKAHIKEKIQHF